MAAIQEFIDEGMVSRVLNVVKSGKEATVYRCRTKPGFGPKQVAVKVYHASQHRNFSKAAVYDAGRLILNGQVSRAVAARTEFGREAQSAIWTTYEYDTMCTLFDAGVPVPEPFAQTDRAILMEFIAAGDEAAPQLAQCTLDGEEAGNVFDTVMYAVVDALKLNLVHGDLSAYNILYGDRGPVIIDFPQAIDPRFNPSARKLLERDIRNVAKFCGRFREAPNYEVIVDELWTRFTFNDWR